MEAPPWRHEQVSFCAQPFSQMLSLLQIPPGLQKEIGKPGTKIRTPQISGAWLGVFSLRRLWWWEKHDDTLARWSEVYIYYLPPPPVVVRLSSLQYPRCASRK